MSEDDIRQTLNERGKRYGAFKFHALASETIQKAMQSHLGWDTLEPHHKEALRMIAHKIGRILNGDPNYDDSWRDIAGYAQLVVDIVNEGKSEKAT